MEIVWRPIALEDLEQISRYIAEHNPRAADRLRCRIISSVERLAVLPGPAASKTPASWSCPTPRTSSPIPLSALRSWSFRSSTAREIGPIVS